MTLTRTEKAWRSDDLRSHDLSRATYLRVPPVGVREAILRETGVRVEAADPGQSPTAQRSASNFADGTDDTSHLTCAGH